MFWNKIKAVYNKEDFDYSKRFVDPKIYHRIFFAVQRAYQVIDEPFATWTYITKTITALCGVGVLTDACLSLYHAIDIFDMSLITESGTYVLMLLYKMMTLITTKVNLSDYIHLIHAMKEDFNYIETKKEKYRKVFFETQLGTWKACFVVISFMFSMGTSLVLFASGTLVVYHLTHTPGDGSHRTLVFPFWAPGVDYTTTPAFEIAFTFANIGVMACCYNYAFVIQTNIVWIRQIAAKADLIGMCINDLLEGIYSTDDEEQRQHFASLINFRMKEIVSQHIIMYSICGTGGGNRPRSVRYVRTDLGVCMVDDCEESPDYETLAFLHIISEVSGAKLSGIHDACWNIRFWDAGPNIRPYLVLIMQRCLRPLPLQMPGFQEVSIKTFSSEYQEWYNMNSEQKADLLHQQQQQESFKGSGVGHWLRVGSGASDIIEIASVHNASHPMNVCVLTEYRNTLVIPKIPLAALPTMTQSPTPRALEPYSPTEAQHYQKPTVKPSYFAVRHYRRGKFSTISAPFTSISPGSPIARNRPLHSFVHYLDDIINPSHRMPSHFSLF
ncbi:unnamed protein product [Chilo suppressalis]|uniref:Odorant receptor n=1 Tax=Chilo suppressalis TaxID=168631 RepID=A0ABN8BBM2_CHISP|nr:unnamed protein product [Chilo suppressalis]